MEKKDKSTSETEVKPATSTTTHSTHNVTVAPKSVGTNSFLAGMAATLGVSAGIMIAIIIAFGVLLFTCCACCFGFALLGSASDSTNTSDQSSENKVYGINEQVRVGDFTVEILNVDNNPAYEDGYFYEPDAGNKFIAVEVKIENSSNSSSSDTYISSYNFSVSDSNSYSYTSSYKTTNTPALAGKNVNKGESIRGWVTFEVDENATGLVLTFDDQDFFDNRTVKFNID